jgi:hypothetical protein
MIANVLVEIYGNLSAINVWMIVYVMIICKTPIYTWNMVVKNEYDYSQNCYLHFEHAGQDDNLMLIKQIYQLLNLMKIIVKWHNQQKSMI